MPTLIASSRHISLFAVLACLCSCATHTIAPAHRLRAGEVVLQGAIDAPGQGLFPRTSIQATAGFSDAFDIGAHVGITPSVRVPVPGMILVGVDSLVVNLGAGGRWYAGKRLGLSLDIDVPLARVKEYPSFYARERLFFWFPSITMRVGSLLDPRGTSGRRGYKGLQLLVTHAPSVYYDASIWTAFGGYLGFNVPLTDSVAFQFEATAGLGIIELGPPVALHPLPMLQLSVAFQKWL